ncbi:hypothetical protein [Siccirubricoccus soli]|nr:hypothetical protein [Siccirubricoccus soli]
MAEQLVAGMAGFGRLVALQQGNWAAQEEWKALLLEVGGTGR